MQVRDVMTKSPVTCPPDMRLREVAKLMAEFDCGEIPVVDAKAHEPIGVITDRDIAVRAVAEGRNPLDLAARDCMSSPVVTVTPDTPVEECARVMEEHKIRRVPVVDAGGACCGIVSQADLARRMSKAESGEIVREIWSREIVRPQPVPAMATDPVCGMRVSMTSPASTAFFDGATFYFCSADCQQKFNQRPESYAGVG